MQAPGQLAMQGTKHQVPAAWHTPRRRAILRGILWNQLALHGLSWPRGNGRSTSADGSAALHFVFAQRALSAVMEYTCNQVRHEALMDHLLA